MKSRYVYLCIWHDRHTDDRFVAYKHEEDAINRCREIVSNFYNERYTFVARSKDEYGNFSLHCSDDYFVMVEKIEVVE